MSRPFSQDWEHRLSTPTPHHNGTSFEHQRSGNNNNISQDNATGRPKSEGTHYTSREAEAIDMWFVDLDNYEKTLEQMAEMNFIESFKEEMRAVDAWFLSQNDCERTAIIYAIMRHCSQLQIRFFLMVLQQMAKKDPIATLLSPRTSLTEMERSHPELFRKVNDNELHANKRLLEVLPSLKDDDIPSDSSDSFRLYNRHSYPERRKVPSDKTYSYPSSSSPSGRMYTLSDNSIPTEPLKPTRPAPPIPLNLRKGSSGEINSSNTGANVNNNSNNSNNNSNGNPSSVPIGTPSNNSFSNLFGSNSESFTNGISNKVMNVFKRVSITKSAEDQPNSNSNSNFNSIGNSQFQQNMSPEELQKYQNQSFLGPQRQLQSQQSQRPNSTPHQPQPFSPPFQQQMQPKSQSQFYNDNPPNRPPRTKLNEDNSKPPQKPNSTPTNFNNVNNSNNSPSENGTGVQYMDIPQWLKSLRLHKYTNILETLSWEELLDLNDEQLHDLGMQALGARRKILKAFETLKAEGYPPVIEK